MSIVTEADLGLQKCWDCEEYYSDMELIYCTGCQTTTCEGCFRGFHQQECGGE